MLGAGPEVRAMTVIGQEAAKRSFTVLALEKHHPFYRMFIRALKQAKMWSGRAPRQNLVRLDIDEHKNLHKIWDEYAEENGLFFLQAKEGNTAQLAKYLETGQVKPKHVFNSIKEFYIKAGRPELAAEVDRIRSVMGF